MGPIATGYSIGRKSVTRGAKPTRGDRIAGAVGEATKPQKEIGTFHTAERRVTP
jgi:hypothetical protein